MEKFVAAAGLPHGAGCDGAPTKNPALLRARGWFSSRGGAVYSPSALATNGGLTSTPVCSGAV